MASTPAVAACSWPWPGVASRLLLLAGLALAGCSAPAGDHRTEFFVFGTRVEVSVRDAVDDNAAGAFRALGADFRRMHREWHPWEFGALGDLNRGLESGGWVRTTPDLVRLIRASTEMERATAGRFHAGIGDLVALWGFHTSDYPVTEPPPSPESIHRILDRRPTLADLEIAGLRVRNRGSSLQLDFSGIAKGLAVENACATLADFRITDALVNAGGDVMVCGSSERPWRVGIPDPAGGVLTTVELTSPMAVITSGSDQRFGEFDGERYAHILDPRTGQPARGIRQATVVHPDPVTADAAATALVVAGPAAWRGLAESLGLERVLVVTADGRVESLGLESEG